MTYAVLAPEHPLVEALVGTPRSAAESTRFRAEVARESEIERLAADRPKRGLRLRARAINPFNGQEIPLFLADYVLMGYGTGRDHGGARRGPARLGFRQAVRPADRATVKRPRGLAGDAGLHG